ncbi:MAG: RNA polymerase sigma factor [Sandaracinaceae bacterium]
MSRTISIVRPPAGRTAFVDDDDIAQCLKEAVGSVRRYVYGRVASGHDGEELVQDSLEQAWARRGTFKGRSSRDLRAWVLGIAVHKVTDYYRRTYRTVRHVDRSASSETIDNATVGEGQSTPESAVETRELLAAYQRALESLSEDERNVFVLYEIEQLKMHEVASALDIPWGTAKSRYKKAREAIKKAVTRAGGGAP